MKMYVVDSNVIVVDSIGQTWEIRFDNNICLICHTMGCTFRKKLKRILKGSANLDNGIQILIILFINEMLKKIGEYTRTSPITIDPLNPSVDDLVIVETLLNQINH